MEDRDIIELYWYRSEDAIAETEKKYGEHLYAVAYHILGDREDAEEQVSDTYLRAWNSIPPQRPQYFSAWLSKITRNLALSRYRSDHREKRGGGQTALALEELTRSIPAGEDPETILLGKELARAIDRFLDALPQSDRVIFVARYYHLYSVGEIAGKYGFTRAKVKSSLFRTRKKLKQYLEEGGKA